MTNLSFHNNKTLFKLIVCSINNEIFLKNYPRKKMNWSKG